MTGVYTNIAKKRAEQSKEANSHTQSESGAAPTPPSSALLSPDQNSGNHDFTKSGKPENQNSGNHELTDSRNQENQNSGKPEIMERASGFVKPEKYSTQLRVGLKQQLAVYATLNQMKDYEVLEKALDEFFEKHK